MYLWGWLDSPDYCRHIWGAVRFESLHLSDTATNASSYPVTKERTGPVHGELPNLSGIDKGKNRPSDPDALRDDRRCTTTNTDPHTQVRQ
jgi:hypothetical protein